MSETTTLFIHLLGSPDGVRVVIPAAGAIELTAILTGVTAFLTADITSLVDAVKALTVPLAETQ